VFEDKSLRRVCNSTLLDTDSFGVDDTYPNGWKKNNSHRARVGIGWVAANVIAMIPKYRCAASLSGHQACVLLPFKHAVNLRARHELHHAMHTMKSMIMRKS
jgi:hypothetical protein